jgi:hypothetical protein
MIYGRNHPPPTSAEQRAKRIEEAARLVLLAFDGMGADFSKYTHGAYIMALDNLRAALAPDAQPRGEGARCACHDGTPMPDGRCQTCLLPAPPASGAPPPLCGPWRA